MDLGEKVRELREGRGLSQKDLADISGVHFNSVSNVESGKRKPHPGTLRKLAVALGVEIEDLTGAPKGEASPSARTPEERRDSYLGAFEVLANATTMRLQEAMDAEDVDFALVNHVERLHADLQQIAVERIGLFREAAVMPKAEVEAQERVAVALDDLRSVIDQSYTAAISKAQGRKAAVKDLGKLKPLKGRTAQQDESRGVRSA